MYSRRRSRLNMNEWRMICPRACSDYSSIELPQKVLAYEKSSFSRSGKWTRTAYPRPLHMNDSYAALEDFFGQTSIKMTGFCRDSNPRACARQRSKLTTRPPSFQYIYSTNMYYTILETNTFKFFIVRFWVVDTGLNNWVSNHKHRAKNLGCYLTHRNI